MTHSFPTRRSSDRLENVADLLNCYEFRLTLEPAAAAAAAARHDAQSLSAIRQALELMRDATNRQSHREDADRSEEHTSELQSLMRNSYAVFCLKNKKNTVLRKHIPARHALR